MKWRMKESLVSPPWGQSFYTVCNAPPLCVHSQMAYLKRKRSCWPRRTRPRPTFKWRREHPKEKKTCPAWGHPSHYLTATLELLSPGNRDSRWWDPTWLFIPHPNTPHTLGVTSLCCRSSSLMRMSLASARAARFAASLASAWKVRQSSAYRPV